MPQHLVPLQGGDLKNPYPRAQRCHPKNLPVSTLCWRALGAEALLLILDLVFHLQSSEYLQNSLGRFGCGVGILSGNQPSINNCVARKW